MQICNVYSHLNGEEFLLARKPAIWKEIQDVIRRVDAAKCKIKKSQEKRKAGRTLYAPAELNKAFKAEFAACNPPWKKDEFSYFVCSDERVNRSIQNLDRGEQKQRILDAGLEPLPTSNETDFVKDRVAVEVQFGKYSFVAHDLYVKHLAFYATDRIDVGVEILPSKVLEREMSSGPTFFEKDLNNLIRQGRGVPSVPLIVIGVGP